MVEDSGNRVFDNRDGFVTGVVVGGGDGGAIAGVAIRCDKGPGSASGLSVLTFSWHWGLQTR